MKMSKVMIHSQNPRHFRSTINTQTQTCLSKRLLLSMFQRLRNSVVLVTGASSGIGEACAHRFADCGSKLILVARRTDRLQKVKNDILHRNPGALVHLEVADVTDASAVAQLPQRLPEPFQSVEVLVNNAGLSLGMDKTWESKTEDIHAMIDTNIKGIMYFVKAFVPGMRERKNGHVINMSSVAGTFRYPSGSVYCASKHGVEAITTVLRMELIDTPIRVTAINPGLVETVFSVVRFKGDKEQAKKPYTGIQPLSGDDVADAVLYAASRLVGYLSDFRPKDCLKNTPSHRVTI